MRRVVGLLAFSGLVAVLSGTVRAQTPTPTRTPTPINVGNFVWDDLDQDGRQDAGEPGLAGVSVQLWNSSKTQLIDTAVTNSNGNYTLVAPTPGNYRVRVLLPSPALDEFSPKDNAAAGDLLDSDINPSGVNFGFTDIYVFGSNLISITSIDAGIIIFRTPTPTRTPTPINVGNFVWHDLDEDGVQDGGEPGLGGVSVQLWNGAMNNLIDTAVTNSNGNYTLVAPTPGDYRVRVLLLPGASFTLKNIGADTTDSDINPSGGAFGFTDIYDFGSNLISITSIDAGMINVTATPTNTPTPTRTPTPTATFTRTPVPVPTGTPTVPITSLVPDSGPSAGGTVFSIFGSGFQPGATVHMGGVPATGETWFSANRVDAISPAGMAPGSLNTVVLENPPAGGFGVKPAAWLSDFLDVPAAHGFHDFVEKLVRNGITAGCGGGNFCVDASVIREQMAVFLLVAAEGSGYAPPPCLAPVFADVPCSNGFSAWINELANPARAITSGCGGGNYCPADAVTREQMAVFLLRAHGGPAYNPPPCTVPAFFDVPCSSPFAAWINELNARGITGGCGGNLYCPLQAVTRGQMAVFLSITFALP
jgi:hypothetical protein